MTEQEILNQIDRIDCQLSPENLHCDGEISRSQAMAKQRRLLAEKTKLKNKLFSKFGVAYEV